jgi:hypothetical protein
VQIASTPTTFTDAGGAGSLSVTATRDCGWSAAANAPWVSLASTSGQGDASVSYTVAANAVAQSRAAEISVEGQTVQVSQAAAPCRWVLNRSEDSAGYAGGTLSVVLTTPTGCGWSTSSDSGWLAITSNANGNTNATIGLSVAANSGPQRVAHALIGGQPYTVTQAAAPAPAAPPPSAPSPAPSPSPSPSPTPTPAPPSPPPPPPPPPPSPTPVSVDGRVSSLSGRCPEIAFVVGGRSVDASGSTSYGGGKCNDVKNGRDVNVTGTQTSGSSVVSASSIRIEK